jgi:hypothetical protein
MSTTFNFASITTEADIKTARDALSKRLAEIKKGLPKEEPVANAGAGKAVEEPVTPVKVTKSKKAAVKTVPEEKPAAKAAGTDEKRKMAFPAGASHTKMLKDAFGDDKKGFENAKKTINKNYEALSREEQEAKTNDERVADWLKLKNETKAEEPMTFDILNIEELKGMKGLTETKQVGIYWHPETGRHVTGQTDSEEGLDEVGDHLVGENTKRVYDKDENFLGFAGIGKFESMKA